MDQLTIEDYLVEKIRGNLNIIFYCTDKKAWGRKGSSVGADGYLRSEHIKTRPEFEQFMKGNPGISVVSLIVKDETFEEWKSRMQQLTNEICYEDS
jgi:hypothetical protein